NRQQPAVTDPHSGSPDNAAAKVLTALKDLGIEHQVMDCDPELADTALFCEHYGIPAEVSANVIIAVGKSDPRQYAACVLLATTLTISPTNPHLHYEINFQ
ncbi:MAG: hypothetical protein HOD33_06890, partial [Acidiferrobacteraceae bacterium]|nr:hypothetical protein [Acidiferrobacteraceae bacterium]